MFIFYLDADESDDDPEEVGKWKMASDEKLEDLCSIDGTQCADAASSSCECSPACFEEANIDGVFVRNIRSHLLGHNMVDGSRKKALAGILRGFRTISYSKSETKKLKSTTISQFYFVNNVKVCSHYFSCVYGVSRSMLTRAVTLAGKDLQVESGVSFGDNHSEFRRNYVAQWIVNYARVCGAEKLPLADNTLTAERAAEEISPEAVDNTSQTRLFQCRVSDLYCAYVESCECCWKVANIKYFINVWFFPNFTTCTRLA